MEKRQDKRAKTSIDNSLKEKVQNLPLLCVEAICKLTPTSKLIRLYSNAVPLPGAFWNFAVESALEKRLPLSLGNAPLHQAANPATIFDAAGARVANIKQPEAFRFSPLCELVSGAILSVSVVCAVGPTDGYRLYVEHGDTILAHLPKVADVRLVVRELHTVPMEGFIPGKDLLEPNLKHLLPQLNAFAIRSDVTKTNAPLVEIPLNNFMRLLPLGNLACLRRLRLPDDLFSDVLQAAESSPASRRVLSGLSSIDAREENGFPHRSGDILPSVSTCYRQVSTLCLSVRGDFKAYLTGLRALPLLDCLGLQFLQRDLKVVTLGERETINSVSDLQLMCQPHSSYVSLRNIASFFPHARTVAVEYDEDRDALDLAFELCIKQSSPAVRTLRCFFGDSGFSSCSSEHMTGFLLANQQHPLETVDLSSASFLELARSPDLLTGIYRAMQGNSTKLLLLRGPVHREALPTLRSHVSLKAENAKITAWKDRDLGDQASLALGNNATVSVTECSQETNVRIVGTKLSGLLKGEQFTIRVVHQFSQPSFIFYFSAV